MAKTLVVGANRGLGLEICRQLAARGDKVMATYRSRPGALNELAGVETHGDIDVADRPSLDTLAQTLGSDTVEVLWVVAGILERVGLDPLDADSVRRQFEVNALGPLQTVAALQKCVREGGKIGLLTSRMGSITDNTSGASYGYRMSKAALNMAGVSLAYDLKPRRIAVRLLHPGWVRTEMTGQTGHLDPPESAQGLIQRMDELTLETTGSFVHQNGEALPW